MLLSYVNMKTSKALTVVGPKSLAQLMIETRVHLSQT